MLQILKLKESCSRTLKYWPYTQEKQKRLQTQKTKLNIINKNMNQLGLAKAIDASE